MTEIPEGLPLHVEVHGSDAGSGVTFVLLHGYGGSTFSWRTWWPTLARRGRTVLVDLKGFGASPKPDDPRYAPDDHAELVLGVIHQLGLRRVVLVGHSMGGGVALLVALRLLDEGEDRLAGLVLVAAAAYRQRLPPFVSLARRPRLSTALLRWLGAPFVAAQVLRTIVYDRSTITRAQVAGYARPLAEPGAHRALIRTALHIVPENLEAVTARYRDLEVPALVLWGRHDPVVPLHVGRRLAASLPQARMVVLERCAHLPAEEHPDASLRAVTAFLDQRLPTS